MWPELKLIRIKYNVIDVWNASITTSHKLRIKRNN